MCKFKELQISLAEHAVSWPRGRRDNSRVSPLDWCRRGNQQLSNNMQQGAAAFLLFLLAGMVNSNSNQVNNNNK
jgi:hypothetical protein